MLHTNTMSDGIQNLHLNHNILLVFCETAEKQSADGET